LFTGFVAAAIQFAEDKSGRLPWDLTDEAPGPVPVVSVPAHIG
jgi:hypothetical protein